MSLQNLSRRKLLGGIAAMAVAGPQAAQALPIVYGRMLGKVGIVRGMQIYDPRDVDLVARIVSVICQQWSLKIDELLINGEGVNTALGILGGRD